MKHYTLITLFLLLSLLSHGQNTSNDVFFVKDIPQFENGGTESFKKYIQKKIRYPDEAIVLGIEGTVFVKFLIHFLDSLPKGKGKADSIQIVKSLHPLLDSVAIQIIKSSPLWTTGKAREKPHNTWITIPVRFEIPNKKDIID
jgi:protein TonB